MAAPDTQKVPVQAVARGEVELGLNYLDLTLDEFDLGSFSDHTTSGQTTLQFAELTPGASVRTARVRVVGQAFHGKLKDFRGTRVTRSPLVYDNSGAAVPNVAGQRAFVVDFGGVRTVLGLRVATGLGIVLVLPWAGTDFSPKAIYPVGGTFAFYALPVPNSTGKGSVGFPAIDTAKLFVQVAGASLPDETQFAEDTRIVSGVLPQNLRASVNGRPVFFTHPGPLDREVELIGLADDLNAIAAAASTPVQATLELAADTPGALLPSFDAATDLVVERSAAARWGGRDTVDVALAASMPTPIELVFPESGALPWQVSRVVLGLTGRFPRWRAFGPLGPPGGKLAAKVNAQFSVARRIVLPGRVTLHGLSLPLVPAGNAELRLEVAADADGAPAGGPPLAAVDLALAPDAPPWTEALFATPLDTGEAQALWAVLKGKSGEARWAATTEPAQQPPATLYTHEGGAWQRYPVRGGTSPAPLLRVLREPLARENAPLLGIALEGAAPASADPSESTQATLDLATSLLRSPDAGAVVLTVTATAAATGTLTVRRATATFGG
jgi:hypothetical protein